MFSFTKVNGLGNSFIVFDEFNAELSLLKSPKCIELLCSQAHGIGADGVIFIREPQDSACHFNMQIFNSDGSEAEMCGNGIRCAAMLYDWHNQVDGAMKVETRAGVKSVCFVKKDNGHMYYKAEMGVPEFDLVKTGEVAAAEKTVEIDGTTFKPVYVNMGNPHAVIFVDKPLSHEFFCRAGAFIERHSNYPKRINVEFVTRLSRSEASVDVWERGCGVTQACGTGACSVAAAGIKEGFFDKEVTISMPGGKLVIEQNADGLISMTGPVIEVANGRISPMLHNLIKQMK